MIKVIYCIGESLSDKENGNTYVTLEKQISEVLNNVELKGKYDNVYVLTISGENIETKIIYDWVFQDNYEIQVDEKPYLEVKPEYIWLTRGNNYTDTVDVMSNVDWFIQ